MIASVRGGPSDLRSVKPAPEFAVSDAEKAAARRVILAHCDDPADILELLGVTA